MSKKHGQYSFFDLKTRLEKIHELNDFLPRLNELVPAKANHLCYVNVG